MGLDCVDWPQGKSFTDSPTFRLLDDFSFIEAQDKQEVDRIVGVVDKLRANGAKWAVEYKECYKKGQVYLLATPGLMPLSLKMSSSITHDPVTRYALEAFADFLQSRGGEQMYLTNAGDGGMLIDVRNDRVYISGKHVHDSDASMQCFDQKVELQIINRKSLNEVSKTQNRVIPESVKLQGHVCIPQSLINAKTGAAGNGLDYDAFESDRAKIATDPQSLLKFTQNLQQRFSPAQASYAGRAKILLESADKYSPGDDRSPAVRFAQTADRVEITLLDSQRTFVVNHSQQYTVSTFFFCVDFAGCIPARSLAGLTAHLPKPKKDHGYVMTFKTTKHDRHYADDREVYAIVYQTPTKNIKAPHANPTIVAMSANERFGVCLQDGKVVYEHESIKLNSNQYVVPGRDEKRTVEDYFFEGRGFFDMHVLARFDMYDTKKNRCSAFNRDFRMLDIRQDSDIGSLNLQKFVHVARLSGSNDRKLISLSFFFQHLLEEIELITKLPSNFIYAQYNRGEEDPFVRCLIKPFVLPESKGDISDTTRIFLVKDGKPVVPKMVYQPNDDRYRDEVMVFDLDEYINHFLVPAKPTARDVALSDRDKVYELKKFPFCALGLYAKGNAAKPAFLFAMDGTGGEATFFMCFGKNADTCKIIQRKVKMPLSSPPNPELLFDTPFGLKNAFLEKTHLVYSSPLSSFMIRGYAMANADKADEVLQMRYSVKQTTAPQGGMAALSLKVVKTWSFSDPITVVMDTIATMDDLCSDADAKAFATEFCKKLIV